MKEFPRGVRGAVLTGVAWAAVWAPVALLIGTTVDPDESMDEIWWLVGAYPGFLCGAGFSVLSRIVETRRGLEEWSLSRSAGCGAVSGLLVGLLPLVLGTPTPRYPPWLLGLVIVGSMTFLSTVSAVGSASLVGVVKKRKRRDVTAGLV
jgi:hypothetical protein